MKRRPSFTLALSFLALIVVGAAALACPFARNAGGWGDPLTALFTACSAVCVTGLSVVDIAAEFSRAGQVVLLALVELGCLGLMTCGTILTVFIGRRLSLDQDFSLMNAYGVAQIHGVKKLIYWVVGSTAAIQVVGAAILYHVTGSAYESVFYSAMSFCNAGFSIRPESLASFAAEPVALTTMALETILGGIGFLVIYNLGSLRPLRSGGRMPRSRLSLHTMVVLRFTAYLLAAAFVAVLILEWNGALASYGFWQKLWVGFYQAVTPRTCGFTVTDVESLRPLTRLVYKVLMFIGGAPGSAAAGMKVTTFAVLLYTLRALCRGERETTLSNHIISFNTVRESIVIFMAMTAFSVLFVGLLMWTESGTGLTSERLSFEALSAITTTGLSIGDTTARLSDFGRVVIMFAMFFGRLGALTVVLMIGDRESKRHIRFPNGELAVG